MLHEILTRGVSLGASDILIVAGLPAAYQINGKLHREGEKLSARLSAELVHEAYELARRDLSGFLRTGDDDFSFSIPGLSRFRMNAFKQRGSLALAIRIIPFSLPDRVRLGIPDAVMRFAEFQRGLVLYTGPAGSGKSTSLACLVDAINSSREGHIVCIEDPIEFLHPHKRGIVTQRELAIDTLSYAAALRAAMRESPSVILIGEMRDPEAIRAAVTAAETGHLVISTLHTPGAVASIDRILDSFPADQQQQIRLQLAMVLRGVVSQQLLHTQNGGLAPAFEIMLVTPAVRSMIRESRTHQLQSVIASSASEGMLSMDQSLLALAQSGVIAADEALRCCLNAEWLQKRLKESALLS